MSSPGFPYRSPGEPGQPPQEKRWNLVASFVRRRNLPQSKRLLGSVPRKVRRELAEPRPAAVISTDLLKTSTYPTVHFRTYPAMSTR